MRTMFSFCKNNHIKNGSGQSASIFVVYSVFVSFLFSPPLRKGCACHQATLASTGMMPVTFAAVTSCAISFMLVRVTGSTT